MPNVSRIICADWAKPVEKRAAYEVLLAERRVRRVAAEVSEVATLLEYAGQGNLQTLVAFDAPIGVPRSFVSAIQRRPGGVGIGGFLDWLFATSFEECNDAEGWTLDAPFFRLPRGGGDGSLRRFAAAAAKQGVDLCRRVERQTGGKTVFLMAGVPGSVGSGARDIWKGLVACRKEKFPFRLWPFEGPLDVMAAEDGPVVAEIYPRAAYATALIDAVPRPRLSIPKADIKDVPSELRGSTREHATDCLLGTKWVESIGAKFYNVDAAIQNEDDFDALMTAAALLRCAVEGLPMFSSEHVDASAEGAILGTGSIDLTLRETTFAKVFGDAPNRELLDADRVARRSGSPARSELPSPGKTQGSGAQGIGCYCGCGERTKSFFAPGHDGRVKGWLLKRHGLSSEQVAAKPLADLAVEFGYGPVLSSRQRPPVE